MFDNVNKNNHKNYLALKFLCIFLIQLNLLPVFAQGKKFVCFYYGNVCVFIQWLFNVMNHANRIGSWRWSRLDYFPRMIKFGECILENERGFYQISMKMHRRINLQIVQKWIFAKISKFSILKETFNFTQFTKKQRQSKCRDIKIFWTAFKIFV